MSEKYFFEVDERGIVNQLSRFACGVAPFGETVYAESKAEAAKLASRYRLGEYWLKRDLYIHGETYPYRGVIHA